ncbi:response regulator [Chitiniphilus purpureus]|uniref:Response regulator n=1 Tax=Chitiniphilus purpureus TaxID=2981137 RepID=A0ABY6DR85_9NEIS|nr:response regulator [Chitiniphilus sp. CD1]UXY14428.1 response regulator [Chitiniphilus sp. CD1]
MTRILLVDDEAHILTALRRSLLTRDEFDGSAPGYAITTFTDPKAALHASESQAFDLVISDYRMPHMDGVAFLTDFRYLQPDCLRIILSGQADMQALARAINEVEIYRFLSKPWQDFELRSTVAGALRFRSLQLENQRLADEVRALRDTTNRQQQALRELEAEHPELAQVRWGPDGSVLLGGD